MPTFKADITSVLEVAAEEHGVTAQRLASILNEIDQLSAYERGKLRSMDEILLEDLEDLRTELVEIAHRRPPLTS